MAYVTPERYIDFRVNLLHSRQIDPADPFRVLETNASPQQAKVHIDLANIWLHQLGIRLRPNTNPRAEGGASSAPGFPGFFDIEPVDSRFVYNVDSREDAQETIRLNDAGLGKIVQINYIDRFTAGSLGWAINYPGNTLGPGARHSDKVNLSFRIMANDIDRPHQMDLLRARELGDEVWGLLVTNNNGDPVGDANLYCQHNCP